jgi:sortase A
VSTTSGPARVVRGAVRGLGVALLWGGGTLLLYVVWLLWFTGVETAAVQQDMLQEFEGFATVEVPGDGTDDPVVTEPDDGAGAEGEDGVEVGGGVAVIEFERPGQERAPVSDDPIVVVEGTTEAALRAGPGHYTFTADPGEPGNFAVAGHRTTWGAPFYDLDQIAPGDLVHVTTRDGTRHTYEVLDGSSGGGDPGQHIVSPRATWVLSADPMDTGGSVLTLTTCHPRWSATYRMIVFAQLVETVRA